MTRPRPRGLDPLTIQALKRDRDAMRDRDETCPYCEDPKCRDLACAFEDDDPRDEMDGDLGC